MEYAEKKELHRSKSTGSALNINTVKEVPKKKATMTHLRRTTSN